MVVARPSLVGWPALLRLVGRSLMTVRNRVRSAIGLASAHTWQRHRVEGLQQL